MQEPFKFENSRGEKLAAVLHRPDAGPVRASAIFAHCFTCTKNFKAAFNIAQSLAEAGIAVLRFDFTGLGQSEGEFVETHFSSNVQDILDGRRFHIRKDFVDDVRSQSVRDGISKLRKALLVMHSPVDELVPVAEAANIYRSALHPKSFISLDDADHLLSRERDSRYAGQVLAAWASRYLQDPLTQPPAARFQKGVVAVAGRMDDQFLCAVNAQGHALLADEPESHGGSDRGPNPYDFLAAALGSCTVMTLNMYARRKEWPLIQVECSVSHDRIHAKDCEDCESKDGKVHVLQREIRIEGDLDEGQRQRLLEIADRCPVHKTLEGEIKIRSSLAQG